MPTRRMKRRVGSPFGTGECPGQDGNRAIPSVTEKASSAEDHFAPTLCSTVHWPLTTLYIVMPPFFRSPFASY